MRKKFSIDAKKVFAFEMTAPLQTILVAQVVKISQLGGGVLPYISHIGMCRPTG